MWKDIKVKGVKFSWCVQDGTLRIHDKRARKHEKKYFSVYRSMDEQEGHGFKRIHVSDNIAAEEVQEYIYQSLKWGLSEYAML